MSVYKDEKTGTWYVSVRYKDWTGTAKRKMKRGFATKKEALAYERQFTQSAAVDLNMLLKDFVEIYFRDKEGELKERSIKNKRYVIECHVIPYLGDKKMNEIRPADIISWQNTIREKHYSESYQRIIQNQVTALFVHAVRIYSLRENPCSKIRKMGKSDVRRLTYWTLEEYQQFLATFPQYSRGYMMFQVLFWTGCRLGEMLALTKADIDLESRRIHIGKTIYRDKGRDIITTPKTPESVRDIDIPEFLAEEIRIFEAELYDYPEDELLFPVSARAVEKQMAVHIRQADVKKIDVHSLRHSICSVLIHQGVPPMVIKERMGHKDIKITLNTYGHLYPSEQKKVASLMDGLNRTSEEDPE